MNALLLVLALSAPSPHFAAPVYAYQSDSVLRRVGTYLYKPADPDFRVLYCIATPPRVTLSCVVHTPTDKLVLIEAIASEQGT